MIDDGRAMLPVWLAIVFAMCCTVASIFATAALYREWCHHLHREQACDAWCHDQRQKMRHEEYLECLDLCQAWRCNHE